MNNIKIYTLIVLAASLIFVGCKDNNGNNDPEPPVDPNTQFSQNDQVGRPAINTVFVTEDDQTQVSEKDEFNTTIPSSMMGTYQQPFENRLLALTQNEYTENVLGLDATTFTSVLSQDVLNVAVQGNTNFFVSPQNFFNGNALTDDEIDIELIAIFGGPNGDGMQESGADFSGLISDNVDSNDKEFLSTFPYLAADH